MIIKPTHQRDNTKKTHNIYTKTQKTNPAKSTQKLNLNQQWSVQTAHMSYLPDNHLRLDVIYDLSDGRGGLKQQNLRQNTMIDTENAVQQRSIHWHTLQQWQNLLLCISMVYAWLSTFSQLQSYVICVR